VAQELVIHCGIFLLALREWIILSIIGVSDLQVSVCGLVPAVLPLVEAASHVLPVSSNPEGVH